MKRYYTTKMYASDRDLADMGLSNQDPTILGFCVDLDRVIAAEENIVAELECTCIYVDGIEQPVSIVDDFEEFCKAWHAQ